MKTLRECVKEAEEKKVAIGHFNISNLEAFHAIYNAARGLGVPVIIGVSEGEEAFVGRDEAAALVRFVRERDNYPLFLNADHHSNFENVKACIDAGYDSVIIDGAKLSFEENVRITKSCVDYARSVGRDVVVEGELGYIGTGSNIKETIPEGAGVLTKPEDAKKFAQMTGVDMLAPSVGNIHGIVKSGHPHVEAKLVREIRESAGVPLVLHGGSGLSDEDFTKAIASGISIIHINTEIRLAYKEGLEKSLSQNPDEVAPYKIAERAQKEMEEIVLKRLKLFNNIK